MDKKGEKEIGADQKAQPSGGLSNQFNYFFSRKLNIKSFKLDKDLKTFSEFSYNGDEIIK